MVRHLAYLKKYRPSIPRPVGWSTSLTATRCKWPFRPQRVMPKCLPATRMRWPLNRSSTTWRAPATQGAMTTPTTGAYVRSAETCGTASVPWPSRAARRYPLSVGIGQCSICRSGAVGSLHSLINENLLTPLARFSRGFRARIPKPSPGKRLSAHHLTALALCRAFLVVQESGRVMKRFPLTVEVLHRKNKRIAKGVMNAATF